MNDKFEHEVMRSLVEQKVSCPYCGESIEILIDQEEAGEQYIEDCQVCCRPIQISFETDDDSLSGIQVDCAS